MYLRKCFQRLYEIERKRIVMPPTGVRMRLNRGERPLPLPEELRRKLRNLYQTKDIQQYPSYHEFYTRLARAHGLNVDQIVVGAGIEEFIRTLMFLCCDPGQKAVVLWPSCAMYDIYAAAFGVDLVRIIPLPDQRQPTVPELIAQIPNDTRLVFIPNPGQPVETYYSPAEINDLAVHCQRINAVLAIDEAHIGFGAISALPLVIDAWRENLLVLRTFSKFFSAASIRVGFAAGQPKLIKALHAVRPSGEVTANSMVVATALLDHKSTMDELAAATMAARDWLRGHLINNGIKAYGRWGFSVLIDLIRPEIAADTARRLWRSGVLVKSGFPDPLAPYIMVACGDRVMMEEFAALLLDELGAA